jgi:hypothetical protein
MASGWLQEKSARKICKKQKNIAMKKYQKCAPAAERLRFAIINLPRGPKRLCPQRPLNQRPVRASTQREVLRR